MNPIVTILYNLAKTENGRQRINQESSLREKITKEALNSVMHEGDEAGKSILWWLAVSESGRELLAQDNNLRQKITAEGLNSIVQNGQDEGTSALYYLAHSPEGSDLLVEDDDLRQLITPEGLNSIVQNGQDAGTSALFWLAAATEGGKIFIEDRDLRQKITPQGLNSIAKYGKFAGESVLFWLAATPEGGKIFIEDSALRQKITSEGLNSVVQNGEYAGTSALFALVINPDGRTLLNNDKRLQMLMIDGMEKHQALGGEFAKRIIAELQNDPQLSHVLANNSIENNVPCISPISKAPSNIEMPQFSLSNIEPCLDLLKQIQSNGKVPGESPMLFSNKSWSPQSSRKDFITHTSLIYSFIDIIECEFPGLIMQVARVAAAMSLEDDQEKNMARDALSKLSCELSKLSNDQLFNIEKAAPGTLKALFMAYKMTSRGDDFSVNSTKLIQKVTDFTSAQLTHIEIGTQHTLKMIFRVLEGSTAKTVQFYQQLTDKQVKKILVLPPDIARWYDKPLTEPGVFAQILELISSCQSQNKHLQLKKLVLSSSVLLRNDLFNKILEKESSLIQQIAKMSKINDTEFLRINMFLRSTKTFAYREIFNNLLALEKSHPRTIYHLMCDSVYRFKSHNYNDCFTLRYTETLQKAREHVMLKLREITAEDYIHIEKNAPGTIRRLLKKPNFYDKGIQIIKKLTKTRIMIEIEKNAPATIASVANLIQHFVVTAPEKIRFEKIFYSIMTAISHHLANNEPKIGLDENICALMQLAQVLNPEQIHHAMCEYPQTLYAITYLASNGFPGVLTIIDKLQNILLGIELLIFEREKPGTIRYIFKLYGKGHPQPMYYASEILAQLSHDQWESIERYKPGTRNKLAGVTHWYNRNSCDLSLYRSCLFKQYRLHMVNLLNRISVDNHTCTEIDKRFELIQVAPHPIVFIKSAQIIEHLRSKWLKKTNEKAAVFSKHQSIEKIIRCPTKKIPKHSPKPNYLVLASACYYLMKNNFISQTTAAIAYKANTLLKIFHRFSAEQLQLLIKNVPDIFRCVIQLLERKMNTSTQSVITQPWRSCENDTAAIPKEITDGVLPAQRHSFYPVPINADISSSL